MLVSRLIIYLTVVLVQPRYSQSLLLCIDYYNKKTANNIVQHSVIKVYHYFNIKTPKVVSMKVDLKYNNMQAKSTGLVYLHSTGRGTA